MFKQLRTVLCISYLSYMFVPIHTVNPDLKPYVDEVVTITRMACKDNQYNHPQHSFVLFKKQRGQVIGICKSTPLNFTVEIDPKYWNRSSGDDKWQLMYHELAHCLLEKEHVNDQHNYMYPSVVKLTKDEVVHQYIQDLKEHCGG